ncbi:MAG: ATP-binding protein [Nitrososphaerales archaeon]
MQPHIEVLRDPSEILARITGSIKDSTFSISNYTDLRNVVGGHACLLDAYKNAIKKMGKDGFRSIVHVSKGKEDLFPLIQSLLDTGIQIRHTVNKPIIEFSIFDSRELYATFEGSETGKIVSNVLFSDEAAYIKHFEDIFEELWKNSTDVRERIAELEHGLVPEVAEIISGRSAVKERILKVIFNAREKLDSIADRHAPNTTLRSSEYYNALRDCHERGVRIRLITDITGDNFLECKRVIKDLGFEIRHVPNITSNMSATEKEFVVNVSSHSPGTRLVYSSVKEFVAQNQFFFEALWEKGIQAETRIREIEWGTQPEAVELLDDPAKVRLKLLDLVSSAARELMILYPSSNAFHRNEGIGLAEALERSLDRGVQVRILSPLDSEISRRILEKDNWQVSSTDSVSPLSEAPAILVREIDPTETGSSISMVLVDKRRAMLIEPREDETREFAKSFGLATLSSIHSTVSSYISFYEKLWHENELRRSESLAREELTLALAREEKLGREARLLQDILAHDVRNYNQVIELASEILAEDLPKSDERIQVVLKTMLNAVNGSTALLERAKKLGRVLSEENFHLENVDLLRSIKDSIALLTVGNRDKRKKIFHELSVKLLDPVRKSGAIVIADELLDEIFMNLFSNAIKYTEGDEVRINTSVEEEVNSWKVAITDHGRGIPDEQKAHIFARYLTSAKGSGLGMSIVRALAVDRYKCEIRLTNRIPGDHTKGTRVEIWFPKKNPSLEKRSESRM